MVGYLTFRPTNGPVQSKMKLKYRAPMFKVEIMITVPARVMSMGITMCQQCLRNRPQDHERIRVAM